MQMEWSRQKLGCCCPDRSTEHHWDDYQKTSHAVRARGQIGRHHSSAPDPEASYCCQVRIPARRCPGRPCNSWIMQIANGSTLSIRREWKKASWSRSSWRVVATDLSCLRVMMMMMMMMMAIVAEICIINFRGFFLPHRVDGSAGSQPAGGLSSMVPGSDDAFIHRARLCLAGRRRLRAYGKPTHSHHMYIHGGAYKLEHYMLCVDRAIIHLWNEVSAFITVKGGHVEHLNTVFKMTTLQCYDRG